ncbi:hypothetical protein ACFLIM_48555 [Nonomuraea sp. M3C6]|uniref:Uncharacterized protein n=1 Tax=Nonomuraea marmarensis TaxID=3351344 RepID=A0ABW7AYD0_9ACTN
MFRIDPVLSEAAAAVSGREGTVLLVADGPDRPDLLLIDRMAGLYAIDLDPNGTSPDDRQPWVSINRKRAELRESLTGLGPPEVGAAVVLGAAAGRLLDPNQPHARRIVLSRQDLTDPAWPDHLPRWPIPDAEFTAIVDRLAPSVVFSKSGRTGATDPGAADRAAARFQLDTSQAVTALVRSPAFSGHVPNELYGRLYHATD